MNDKEIEQQINDIIEGEIQNTINEYLEQQEESKGEDSGLGFVKDENGKFQPITKGDPFIECGGDKIFTISECLPNKCNLQNIIN